MELGDRAAVIYVRTPYQTGFARKRLVTTLSRSRLLLSRPLRDLSRPALGRSNVAMPDAEEHSATERRFGFRCLRCQSVLEAAVSQSGRQGQCPSCGAVFTIPAVDWRSGLAVSDADPGADGELPIPVHAYAAAGEHAPQIVRHKDDSLAIICPRCQRECSIVANSCTGCGLPFTMEGASPEAETAGTSQGRAALTVGIVALLTCWCPGVGIVSGLLAIGLGFLVPRHPGGSLPWRGWAAVMLGAASAIISAVMFSDIVR